MKPRKPTPTATVDMFAGIAQPQLPGLEDYRDLSAGEQPSPLALEQERRNRRPLPGQTALEEQQP